MCSELRVWEAERDLAMRRLPLEVPAEVRIPAIRDARYALYDAHASAARRHHAAFLHFVAIFPQLAATDVCPKRPDDQVLMVLGLTSGLNAVLHDQAANGIEAVPLSIAHQVRTWSTCLDDTQWWGLPSAISAAVDITFPGGQPEEGWLRLSEAARKGDQAGVRLSRAFAMVVASMTGDESRAREELTAFRVSLETVAAPEAWALLDAYAYGLARQQSDLLWIQASGHRTPPGAVGQFP
jgi:hypothetical protein